MQNSEKAQTSMVKGIETQANENEKALVGLRGAGQKYQKWRLEQILLIWEKWKSSLLKKGLKSK